MPDEATIKTRIADARQRIGSRLDELHHGIAHVRKFVADPWIRFGTAVAVGYVVGSREHHEPEMAKPRQRPPETILHAMARTALTTLLTAAIRRVIYAAITERAAASERAAA